MKCAECCSLMKKVKVSVEGARNKIMSWQCRCGNFIFNRKSGLRVVAELERKSGPLKVEQKIIKLQKIKTNYCGTNSIL